MTAGECGKAVDHAVEVCARKGGRQREGQERPSRFGAHRCQIAQIDGECSMADRGWRRKTAIEVNALDERVDGDHFELVPLRLDDRRIVSDADDEPVGRWGEPRLNASDELALGEI